MKSKSLFAVMFVCIMMAAMSCACATSDIQHKDTVKKTDLNQDKLEENIKDNIKQSTVKCNLKNLDVKAALKKEGKKVSKNKQGVQRKVVSIKKVKNGQNSGGYFKEIRYSDGGFRQYNEKGKLIGSSNPEDQKYLPSIE